MRGGVTVFRFGGHGRIHHPRGSEPDAWESIDCGWCSRHVSAAVVAFDEEANQRVTTWLQCPACLRGSVRNSDWTLHPAPRPLDAVVGVPGDIARAWEEARSAFGAGAHSAAELVCRKILMHVAVEKGAPAGLSFAAYVTYLVDQGHVTAVMRPWVDQIRIRGNEATHELVLHDARETLSVLTFTHQMLTLIYAMEHLTRGFVPTD